jgi:hypothetical protein
MKIYIHEAFVCLYATATANAVHAMVGLKLEEGSYAEEHPVKRKLKLGSVRHTIKNRDLRRKTTLNHYFDSLIRRIDFLIFHKRKNLILISPNE